MKSSTREKRTKGNVLPRFHRMASVTSESDFSAHDGLLAAQHGTPILGHAWVTCAHHPWVHLASLTLASVWMMGLPFTKQGVSVEVTWASSFTDRVCCTTSVCLKLCWELGCGDWGRWLPGEAWSLQVFRSWDYTPACSSAIKCSASFLSYIPVSFHFFLMQFQRHWKCARDKDVH